MSTRYSAPGKVFLLGEYAVLAGRPAIVAALPPRFSTELARAPFEPATPAGRLLAQAGESEGWVMRDPHLGAGGFGASTAEFAMAYRRLAEHRGWALSAEAVIRKYQELHAAERVPPSGADLFTQWAGGVVAFDPSQPARSERVSPRARIELLVFSATGQAGRKVATHEHLSRLDGADLRERFAPLAPPLEAGLAALRAGDSAGLGRAFSAYAEALRSLGLELPEATADREAISRLPGVAGAKGAGAMLADAVVAVLDPEAGRTSRRSILAAARSRGLVPVFEGWPAEEGIRCDP
jgi:mevalonate kinase